HSEATSIAASTLVSSSSEDAAAMTWAYARAALVLRTEALAKALKWVDSSLVVQVAFRAFRCRKAYKTLLERRNRATLLLQCTSRRKKAFAVAKGLREQRCSEWEQLWDEKANQFYYFHKTTMESLWEEPSAPYRPMVRDPHTARMIQAWPQLERENMEAREAEPGFCMRCKIERATRLCDQCVHKDKAAWHGGLWHFCFACFA
ncbi:unnamed protein product, partial [Discosporangium mesarthrocarpum]